MTLNRYIYSRDNPERYTDPTGHVFIDEGGVLYVASGAALRAAEVIPPPPSPTTAASASDSVVVTSTRSPDVVLAESGDSTASGEGLTLQQRMNAAGVSGTSANGGVIGSGPSSSSDGGTTSGSSVAVTGVVCDSTCP